MHSYVRYDCMSSAWAVLARNEPCRTCDSIKSHVRVSRVTRMNESCRACAARIRIWSMRGSVASRRVMSHLAMALDVAHVNGSHMLARVSHVNGSHMLAHVAHVNGSHVLAHVAYVNGSYMSDHVAHIDGSHILAHVAHVNGSHMLAHVAHVNGSQCWLMSHMWMAHTCWLMPHMWMAPMCRLATSDELCHTYESVTSHVRMSHVTNMNESCHTYEWVMSRMRSAGLQRVMSHIRMSHVSHMNESCHTYECVTSHVWTSHVAHAQLEFASGARAVVLARAPAMSSHEGMIAGMKESCPTTWINHVSLCRGGRTLVAGLLYGVESFFLIESCLMYVV